MRKYLTCLLLFLFFSRTSYAQQGLFQLSKSYFRSDPFTGEFSSFLKHLINDPLIKNKEIRHRTDSSLFYFAGVYNSFNPFFFKPKKIEIILEELPVQYADSIQTDTIFVYQLLAYTGTDNKAEQEVKTEFSKIHRQINKKFDSSNYQELKAGSLITGGVHNYFVEFAGIAPVSIAWGRLEENSEYLLNIKLRFKTSDNKAVLPASLYHSQ